MSASPDAGWSSLVARRAHNPKVAGSNPAPATKETPRTHAWGFLVSPLVSALLATWDTGARLRELERLCCRAHEEVLDRRDA